MDGHPLLSQCKTILPKSNGNFGKSHLRILPYIEEWFNDYVKWVKLK